MGWVFSGSIYGKNELPGSGCSFVGISLRGYSQDASHAPPSGTTESSPFVAELDDFWKSSSRTRVSTLPVSMDSLGSRAR